MASGIDAVSEGRAKLVLPLPSHKEKTERSEIELKVVALGKVLSMRYEVGDFEGAKIGKNNFVWDTDLEKG